MSALLGCGFCARLLLRPPRSLRLPLPTFRFSEPRRFYFRRLAALHLFVLLPSLGFFTSPTLLRRHPRLTQCVRYVATELLDLLPNFRRIVLLVAQVAPIEILARRDNFQDRVIAPLLFVLERRDWNIENGKHQIVAAKLRFARKKRFELDSAMLARGVTIGTKKAD